MAMSAKDVVPLEDLIMVPTPPPDSSSSTSPPHLLLSRNLPQMENHSTSLFKPRPERRPIVVTPVSFLQPEKQEDATRQTVGGERKEILMDCEQERRGCSSTSSSSSWLALATPNPPLQ
ncbi:hypothetical protein Patl1_20638 [Pistacia atlantica]|uniref:Uncharacterized protein n=1 Tax=Pistacia atlantica TaxID=434234 RepID=A0ACC1BNH9_9ROSI|nr:hypothetical protein Patl1_20638 [Pistacia atlantica]